MTIILLMFVFLLPGKQVKEEKVNVGWADYLWDVCLVQLWCSFDLFAFCCVFAASLEEANWHPTCCSPLLFPRRVLA